MKETLAAYVKRVSELQEHVKGNEEATKQSLIAPLFMLLGYDMTDPRECMPEYKVDFGKDRSTKPIDWAFFQNGRPAFFVEAKEVTKKLAAYDEQLADYFAKAPEAKIGILTNGVQWRFFTDLVNDNVMDKEPFIRWDVLGDEAPPFDFLTLLQRSQFSAQLIRTFAERKRSQNLLVNELVRLLEPSLEFTKLAIANVETRNLTTNVIESWKPIVASAISEWAKQRALASVLRAPQTDVDVTPTTEDATKPGDESPTPEERAAFAVVCNVLGSNRPAAHQHATTYSKVHLRERHTWVVCRLYLGRRRPKVWLPLPIEQVRAALPDMDVATPESGWTSVTFDTIDQVEKLKDLLRASWDALRTDHPAMPASATAA